MNCIRYSLVLPYHQGFIKHTQAYIAGVTGYSPYFSIIVIFLGLVLTYFCGLSIADVWLPTFVNLSFFNNQQKFMGFPNITAAPSNALNGKENR